MEIIALPSYATSPVLYFTHKEVQLSMPTGTLLRTSMSDDLKTLFYHLNWFFNQLSEERQGKIFALYARAERLLRRPEGTSAADTSDMPSVNSDLREILAELLDQMPSAELFKWISPNEMYPWPAATDLPRSYAQAVSTKYPEEKTYIFREYQELFTLILQLRAVVPIWAAYLARYPQAFDTDYRDMVLVSLLNESTFDQSPAFKRLKLYVDAWVGGKADVMESGVMRGISSDEYPHWLMCNVLVRKEATQSFEPPVKGDGSPFVIKHLSNHIRERLTKTDAEFGNPERKKVINKDPVSQGDDQRSVYEAHRIKQVVGNGARWLIQIYCEDPLRLLRSLEPEMDTETAKRIFDAFSYGDFVPSNEQLLIAMWVVSPSVSPRAEEDLSRVNAAIVCAAATAVLWHRKHYALATFISARQGQPITRASMINPSSIRYSKEIYPEIERLFPHVDKLRNIQPLRVGVTNIVTTAENYMWQPQLPADMIKIARNEPIDNQNMINLMITGTDSAPFMQIQQSLASAIMIAIIDLAKRPLAENAWDKATRIAKEMNLPMTPVPWDPVPPLPRSFS